MSSIMNPTQRSVRLNMAAATFAAVLAAVAIQGSAAADGNSGPIVGSDVSHGASAPLRSLAPAEAGEAVAAPARINPLAGQPDQGRRGTDTRGTPETDPLIESVSPPAAGSPRVKKKFQGNSNPTACGGCLPPDTTGDVGPNHYIQLVNATKILIFNKAGTVLVGPINLGSLWSTGNCQNNAGDPGVLYDPLADRWVLAQFATPNHLCFAISQTADPTGLYWLYEFDVGSFPDYFKIGVWRNGYYVSANEATYTAYAFNRTAMLAGAPANYVKFPGQTNFLMPADTDGPRRPKGTGLFYTFKDNVFHGGKDRIELFKLKPDFVTPANSTFNKIKTLKIASFSYTVCGFFVLDCIPQLGTVEGLDPVSEWPMQRFAYHRVGKQQSLVGNFTVGGGTATPGAAIRWFELRYSKSKKKWVLYQQGTHDLGDGLNRFMGSIAMDDKGNIALGYSASSSTTNPSIRYATRRAGDPLGTLRSERVLQASGGSQTSSANRWGDYSAMSVDPADGCTFWYTNEFYAATSTSTWSTMIGAFKDKKC